MLYSTGRACDVHVHCTVCVCVHVFISILLFRLNLFYDHCYCISLECHDPVDDVLDFCRRLMALSSAQEVSS